jgi:hypothetical protein
MMEKPNTLLDKHNTQFLCGLEYRAIILASARSSDVFST